MEPDVGRGRAQPVELGDAALDDRAARRGRVTVLSARLTIVGLGPAGPELVNIATLDTIDAVPAEARFLRTSRHPSASLLAGVATFDHVYESEPTFDAVYRRIADELFDAAHRLGHALYAVPGSPRVLERTVDLLAAEAGDRDVEIVVVPALSFLDLAWVRLGIDPLEEGVRLVDGHRFASAAAGERGPLLVAHCHNQRVLSDIKLAYEDEAPDSALVLQRLGLPDERVAEVAWADLDRTVEPDHLTSVFIAAGAPPVAAEVARFDLLVRTLRERCPWDREQTHATLTRHLLEETYEVLEAIEHLGDDGDGYEHLEEELGDLLFQVVFHATLAREAGAFTLADVARGIHDKLVVRHPHVFGSVTAESAGEVMTNWEHIKKAEKGRESVFEGIPHSLPSLLYAHKVLRKAATLGVEVPAPPVDDVGAALLGLVAAARAADVDPEA
ncbi:MAG: MazG family protein, partial [Acidimicrobiales bacterium]